MKTILGLTLATALAAAGSISGAKAAATILPGGAVNGPIVLVEGGCGPDYHRGPDGYCHPNWREWQNGWRACPPGYHLGREERRCWPN